MTKALQKGAEPIKGLRIVRRLQGHTSWIHRLAWSPDGTLLASASSDCSVRIWEATSGKCLLALSGHLKPVTGLSWAPDCSKLASGSTDATVRVWDPHAGDCLAVMSGHNGIVYSVSWSHDGATIASGSDDSTIKLWDARTYDPLSYRPPSHRDSVFVVAFAPNASFLASGSADGSVQLWDLERRAVTFSSTAHSSSVRDIAWLPTRQMIATTSTDRRSLLWNATSGELIHTMEGHTDSVNAITATPDGLLIATKAYDNTVTFWRAPQWRMGAHITEPSGEAWPTGLSFHPFSALLATSDQNSRAILIWTFDIWSLLHTEPSVHVIDYASAKIVLLGESNSGKSCFAMRLSEDRYPNDNELGTTHGMRFWRVQPETLSSHTISPPGQRRDIIIWDLGGQDEYRLVHQLFLQDCTIALFLFDSTRGQAAFSEVETWNKYLETQAGAHKPKKLLIGTKLERGKDLVDRIAVTHLTTSCGAVGYYETSSLTGDGFPEVREVLASLLDWDSIAKTSRPELFQQVRDAIIARRDAGEVVVGLSDIEDSVVTGVDRRYEADAIISVTNLLAAQGLIARSALPSGETVFVLQIAEIERYAGAMIVFARNNAHGIPAIDTQQLALPDLILPGIELERRLPWMQEKVVIACVVQLLLQHGICFQHQGLLIFPSLFRPSQPEATELLSHSVALYYDFSGAIDNVYASLIAWLVLAKGFGRVRLWTKRAEFETPADAAYGIRKTDKGRGFAHLDVYFANEVRIDAEERSRRRQLFISFIEDHLKQHGIDVIEGIDLQCRSCHYEYDEATVRMRIANGHHDIGCPDCDARVEIAAAAHHTTPFDERVEHRLVALRTTVRRNVQKATEGIRNAFNSTPLDVASRDIIVLLHLSDLHFTEKTDGFRRSVRWCRTFGIEMEGWDSTRSIF